MVIYIYPFTERSLLPETVHVEPCHECGREDTYIEKVPARTDPFDLSFTREWDVPTCKNGHWADC
jgi:hypothetical protein